MEIGCLSHKLEIAHNFILYLTIMRKKTILRNSLTILTLFTELELYFSELWYKVATILWKKKKKSAHNSNIFLAVASLYALR